MRKSTSSAFTLVELLTVLAIIVILTGLVVAVSGYVQKKASLARAGGEIALLISACESYKSDNGSHPRDTGNKSVTDAINPMVDFIPTDKKYTESSLFLYKELSGDKTGSSNSPDGIPDDGQPRYLKDIEPRILKVIKNKQTNVITEVLYLQDPFGFPYAYSTSAAKDEQTYQTNLLKDPKLRKNPPPRATGNAVKGFNPGSYDLWSTGGRSARKGGDTNELLWASWVKNW